MIRINGGAARIVSNKQTVDFAATPTGLNYTWSCTTVDGETCLGINGPIDLAGYTPSISAGELPVGFFEISVRGVDMRSGLADYFTQTLEVNEREFAISCAPTAEVFALSEPAKISIVAAAGEIRNVTWEIEDIPSSQLLVTSAGVILPLPLERGIIDATVTAMGMNNETVSCTTSVLIESPVAGGGLKIEPSSGVEFTTEFMITAPSWEAADGYESTYKLFYVDANGVERPLTEESSATEFNIYLPAGVDTDADVLEIILEVISRSKHSVRTTATVTVTPLSDDDRAVAISAIMDAAAMTGSLDLIIPTLSARKTEGRRRAATELAASATLLSASEDFPSTTLASSVLALASDPLALDAATIDNLLATLTNVAVAGKNGEIETINDGRISTCLSALSQLAMNPIVTASDIRPVVAPISEELAGLQDTVDREDNSGGSIQLTTVSDPAFTYGFNVTISGVQVDISDADVFTIQTSEPQAFAYVSDVMITSAFSVYPTSNTSMVTLSVYAAAVDASALNCGASVCVPQWHVLSEANWTSVGPQFRSRYDPMDTVMTIDISANTTAVYAVLSVPIFIEPSCGNAIVEAGEDCDPLVATPGCTNCSLTVGWTCSGDPSVCLEKADTSPCVSAESGCATCTKSNPNMCASCTDATLTPIGASCRSVAREALPVTAMQDNTFYFADGVTVDLPSALAKAANPSFSYMPLSPAHDGDASFTTLNATFSGVTFDLTLEGVSGQLDFPIVVYVNVSEIALTGFDVLLATNNTWIAPYITCDAYVAPKVISGELIFQTCHLSQFTIVEGMVAEEFCEIPPVYANGTTNCDGLDNISIGQKCNVTCGADLLPYTFEVTCNSSLQWPSAICYPDPDKIEYLVPVCDPVPTNFTDHINGCASMDPDDVTPDVACNITCADGYRLIGIETTISCNFTTYAWKTEPLCEIIPPQCNVMPVIDGVSTTSCSGGTVDVGTECFPTCLSGYVSLELNFTCDAESGEWPTDLCHRTCEAFPTDVVSNCSTGALFPSSTCEISACSGEGLIPAVTYTSCDPVSGYFATSETLCKARAVCQPMPAWSNGAVTSCDGADVYQDMNCTVTCPTTRRIRSLIACESDGSWSMPEVCDQYVSCDSFPSYKYGNITTNKTVVYADTVVTVTCPAGMVAVDPTPSCDAVTGEWPTQICFNPRACNTISGYETAITHCLPSDTLDIESRCSFNCSEGLKKTVSVLQCSPTDGTWPTTPCVPYYNCSAMPVYNHTTATCDRDGYLMEGQSCSFTCERGSKTSIASFTCVDGADWPATICEEIPLCPAIPSYTVGSLTCLNNTNTDDICNVTCPADHRPLMSQSSCAAGWPADICEFYCPHPTPEVGAVYCPPGTIYEGDQCVVQCPETHFAPLHKITCTQGADWPEACVLKPQCEANPIFPSGSLNCSSDPVMYLDYCDVLCPDYFDHVVDASITCALNATWPQLLCVEQPQCKDLNITSPGSLDCPAWPSHVDVPCAAVCPNSHVPVSPNPACDADGNWPDRLCIVETCNPAAFTGIGQVVCSDPTRGENCTATCPYTHTPIVSDFTCTIDGEWPEILCEALPLCPNITTYLYGRIECDMETPVTTSQCTPVCPTPLETVSTNVSCGSELKWPDQVCVEMPVCDSIPKYTYGTVTCPDGPVFNSSACDVSCKGPLNPLESTVACDAAGQWPSEICDLAPMCKTPSYNVGTLWCHDNIIVNTLNCTVTCPEGYSVIDEKVTCDENGNWAEDICSGPPVTGQVSSDDSNSTTVDSSETDGRPIFALFGLVIIVGGVVAAAYIVTGKEKEEKSLDEVRAKCSALLFFFFFFFFFLDMAAANPPGSASATGDSEGGDHHRHSQPHSCRRRGHGRHRAP